jgi:hypothetical protein
MGVGWQIRLPHPVGPLSRWPNLTGVDQRADTRPPPSEPAPDGSAAAAHPAALIPAGDVGGRSSSAFSRSHFDSAEAPLPWSAVSLSTLPAEHHGYAAPEHAASSFRPRHFR